MRGAKVSMLFLCLAWMAAGGWATHQPPEHDGESSHHDGAAKNRGRVIGKHHGIHKSRETLGAF